MRASTARSSGPTLRRCRGALPAARSAAARTSTRAYSGLGSGWTRSDTTYWLLNVRRKRGRLADARNMFDGTPHRDVVAWTAMISRSHRGRGCRIGPRAVRRYERARSCPQRATAHRFHTRRGAEGLHGGFGLGVYASETFVGLAGEKDVSWNAFLIEYEDGDYTKVTLVFQKLVESGDEISKYTLPAILECCMELDLATSGCDLQLHSYTIKSGWGNSVVSSALVDMYVKCRNIIDAEMLFAKSDTPDLVEWNTIICGYAYHGRGYKALEVLWAKKPAPGIS
ncbi:hypothetical protein ABZP36_015754 [Zizania latifolia]